MAYQIPADNQNSKSWGIADLTSLGLLFANWATYDLYNRDTKRAHRLHVYTGGLSYSPGLSHMKPPNDAFNGIGGLGSASMNFSIDYNYFTTKRPMNFFDFDYLGAQVAGISLGVYSGTRLEVFDGPLLTSPMLFGENFTSWGISFPSGSLGWGFTTIEIGTGLPLGDPDPVVKIDLPPSPEEIDDGIQITQKEDKMLFISIEGDILFPFDESTLKKEALKTIKQVGEIIHWTFNLISVTVEGHTDSIGSHEYNNRLSLDRAEAVEKKLRKYLRKGVVMNTPLGKGKTEPVAPNTKPDGSDDPVGRQKNRRVNIYLRYK